MTTHLLFDFFGTLVDYSPSRTEQGFERSFALLQKTGATLDYESFLAQWSALSEEFDREAERSHREFSMQELGRAFLPGVTRDPSEAFVSEFVQTYVAEWSKGIRYLDGLPEMLERLGRRFQLAIITNTHDPALVPGHLERMGVSKLFESVTTSVEVGRRKPSADIFDHALGVLGTNAEACIYVGDNYEADYLGARSVEMRGLLIDPDRQAAVAPADRLDSILDLESLLARSRSA